MAAIPPDIGPYHVVRPLGQGGMGTVLLAEDPRLARRVALKIFSGAEARGEYAREQLLREARAAASLSHPNIAAVHDVLDVDGQVAIVFEYVEGDTLASRVGRGPIPIPMALDIGLQLADALAAAHDRGIVHRDLKPANVIITADGKVKVLDFGVARVMPRDPSAVASAHTTGAVFVGTVGYAAPEQCLGQAADARADVFSLGVVLYEMLTGARPFPGRDATTIVRTMLQSDPPHAATAVPGISEPLDRLIASALARDPAKRPQTARQVRELLAYIAPTDVRIPYVSPRKRYGWFAAAILAAAVGTGALLSSLLSNRPAPGAIASGAQLPVIAVLPLANASGDSSKDYLALGVAENLITRLAALPKITVLSRSAVADARNRLRGVPALAAELDATYLVDGSVQQAGDLININLRLVRSDASVAWADTVVGRFDQIFDLQTRLASALAQALAVQLTPADRASLAQQPTMNAEALAAYWRGRVLLERRDVPGNLESALSSFDAAVKHDALFADAHAARGETLWAQYLQRRDPPLANAALDAGLMALRIDPNRANVRYSLALTLKGSGQLEQAAEELQRALALRSNYDDARRELGDVLARQGRIDEAVAEFQKAIALRPGFWGHYSTLGVSLYQAARYDAAIAAFTRVVELQPDSAFGYQQLGTVYQVQGDTEKALENYRQAIARGGTPQAYTNMGGILHQKGDYEGAIAAYTKALELRPNSHVTHRNLGDALRRVGRVAQARASYLQAIAVAESELQVNPRDARTMAYLAVYLAKAGRNDEASKRIARAREIAPGDVQVMYRSGVVHALLHNTDRAISDIAAALAKGFSRQSVMEDEDLEALRASPKFQAIVSASSVKGVS